LIKVIRVTWNIWRDV